MLQTSKEFIQKRLAAAAKQRENSNIVNIGTFAEYMQELNVQHVSAIRHKKRFYITLYAADKTTVLDNIIFSETLGAAHVVEPYTVAEVLDLPVYGITTQNEAGEEIYICSLGVVAVAKDDLVSLASVYAEIGKTLPNNEGVAAPKAPALAGRRKR